MAVLIVFLFTLAYPLSDFWFQDLVLVLNVSVMVLAGGESLWLQTPTIIIIKSIEFEFDSCHLSTIDHSDPKKSLHFFFLTFISTLFDI